MRHLGHFDLAGLLLNLKLDAKDTFPLTPQVGSIEMIQKRVMLCVSTDDGLPLWIPLTNEMNMYVHAQDTPSITWIIKHNMNFSTPMIQFFDTTGAPMSVESVTPVDTNTIQVTMLHAMAGRAVCITGTMGGLPKEPVAFTTKVAGQSTWTINHGLGYKPRVEIYIGGYEVQASVVHASDNMSLTITFDGSPMTGEVFCY